jgi:hypothetical protein
MKTTVVDKKLWESILLGGTNEREKERLFGTQAFLFVCV